jgi:hypothetical protein
MEYSRVSYVFSDEQLDTITQAINTIKETIAPTRISMTAKDRMKLTKMGDGSHPFTEHALKHADRHPEFLPNYSTIEEFRNDWTLTMQLKEIKNVVSLLSRDVEDTYMAAGADSFAHAREYYNTTRRAAKNNIPGALTIFNDLKPRFIKTYDDENEIEASMPDASSPAITDSTAGE